ncbi:unnamed protein product [Nippostrongylus brasiliensis]|uniref:Collagen alpha-1(IV) chain n=1 Tax=Nippostrongylus brasiliensis TaxID=27835 RepID=A0A0N4XVE7_NIPBR|nr:hypothetical protein Q1695_016113 [Nippostrongylus brasiliensis]VDL70357.1 unnamed protein product [Nippostrongylus brasiliensis]
MRLILAALIAVAVNTSGSLAQAPGPYMPSYGQWSGYRSSSPPCVTICPNGQRYNTIIEGNMPRIIGPWGGPGWPGQNNNPYGPGGMNPNGNLLTGPSGLGPGQYNNPNVRGGGMGGEQGSDNVDGTYAGQIVFDGNPDGNGPIGRVVMPQDKRGPPTSPDINAEMHGFQSPWGGPGSGGYGPGGSNSPYGLWGNPYPGSGPNSPFGGQGFDGNPYGPGGGPGGYFYGPQGPGGNPYPGYGPNSPWGGQGSNGNPYGPQDGSDDNPYGPQNGPGGLIYGQQGPWGGGSGTDDGPDGSDTDDNLGSSLLPGLDGNGNLDGFAPPDLPGGFISLEEQRTKGDGESGSESPFGEPGTNDGNQPFGGQGPNGGYFSIRGPGSNGGYQPFGGQGPNGGYWQFGGPGSNGGYQPFGGQGSNGGYWQFGGPGSGGSFSLFPRFPGQGGGRGSSVVVTGDGFTESRWYSSGGYPPFGRSGGFNVRFGAPFGGFLPHGSIRLPYFGPNYVCIELKEDEQRTFRKSGKLPQNFTTSLMEAVNGTKNGSAEGAEGALYVEEAENGDGVLGAVTTTDIRRISRSVPVQLDKNVEESVANEHSERSKRMAPNPAAPQTEPSPVPSELLDRFRRSLLITDPNRGAPKELLVNA